MSDDNLNTAIGYVTIPENSFLVKGDIHKEYIYIFLDVESFEKFDKFLQDKIENSKSVIEFMIKIGDEKRTATIRQLWAMLDPEKSYSVPPGFKLVPVEPTEDMIIAGFESKPCRPFDSLELMEKFDAMSGCEQSKFIAKRCYEAMLSAAPQPSQPPIQEPIAWLHRIRSNPQFVRTVYHTKRTDEEITIIEADGDELVPLYAEPPPILPDREGDPLQALVDQAQELDMGYGKPAEKVEEKPWIEWGGGDCPVEEGTLVDLIWRDQSSHFNCNTGFGAAVNWENDLMDCDIIAYRLS